VDSVVVDLVVVDSVEVGDLSLETWPSGRTQYATFRDKSAVCVQHAFEDFDIKFTCSS